MAARKGSLLPPPGDLVLDPFAGSGRTAVAAAFAGRDHFWHRAGAKILRPRPQAVGRDRPLPGPTGRLVASALTEAEAAAARPNFNY